MTINHHPAHCKALRHGRLNSLHLLYDDTTVMSFHIDDLIKESAHMRFDSSFSRVKGNVTINISAENNNDLMRSNLRPECFDTSTTLSNP